MARNKSGRFVKQYVSPVIQPTIKARGLSISASDLARANFAETALNASSPAGYAFWYKRMIRESRSGR